MEEIYIFIVKKYLHFSNKTYDDSYEGPLVFVKQNFLTKQKKQSLRKSNIYFILLIQNIPLTTIILPTKNSGKIKKFSIFQNLFH